MKPRHAAALALVGWYLMMPPLSEDHHHVDYGVPFAGWLNYDKYDSDKQCEQMRAQLAGGHFQDLATSFIFQQTQDEETVKAVKNALRSARCFRIDEIAN